MIMQFISQPWSAMRNFFQEKQLSFAGWMLLLSSGVLQFVFSLSHVIALRILLLLIAFLISLKYFWGSLETKSKPLFSAVLILVLLQVWMLVVSGFIADQPLASFSEWKGQWLPVLMAFVVGIGLVRTLTLSKFKDTSAVVVMSILIPITTFLTANAVVIIHDWILAGRFLPSLGGIGDHHGISSYLVGLLEPILFVDLFSRIVNSKRILPLPGWASFAVLILSVGTLVGTTDRNGILSMLLTFAMVIALMFSEIRKKFSPGKISCTILAMLVFVLSVAFVSYKIDPRWKTFIETVPIAWNIDHDLLWLNADNARTAPLTPSGRQVDISEYSRIAWAHEGWRMLVAHPWGLEISRGTFHRLVLEKYGHAEMSHSHNSWIDFGLEVGLPGLILWGWFLVVLGRFGLHAWRLNKEPIGLALAVLIIMIGVRGLLDSIFRDHEIVQFMLIASLLYGSLLLGYQNTATQTSN